MKSGIAIKQRTGGNKTNKKENTVHLVTGPYGSVRSYVVFVLISIVLLSMQEELTSFNQSVLFFSFQSVLFFFLKDK